jgi:AcrR family transcriptional regulator
MTPTLSPKQQEIRDREKAILDVAAPMLVAEGYHGLSMDRIASQLRYAKGTIYNHYPNKEEIILAIAVDCVKRRQEMFDRAALSKGCSRDRMQAIGVAFELYTRVYNNDFKIEQVIRNESVWEKTSQKRREMLMNWEQQCMSMIAGIVRDAVSAGDLDVTPAVNIPEMIFGFWALTYGSYVLLETSPSLVQLGITDVYRSIRINSHRLLNGIPWKPIRTQEEDLAMFERKAHEVFPNELSKLTHF